MKRYPDIGIRRHNRKWQVLEYLLPLPETAGRIRRETRILSHHNTMEEAAAEAERQRQNT